MTPQRKIIHDIRNCQNSLALNSGYLSLFSREDVIESLQALVTSADDMCKLIAKLEFLRDGSTSEENDSVQIEHSDSHTQRKTNLNY
jgi:hypothetical protein